MKKYAVIKSAYYTSSLLTYAYHHLNYEHICGFSLGKGIIFFDSLEAAKRVAFPSYPTEAQPNDFDRRKQQAIISLECDESESHVTNIEKIYTVSDVREEYHPLNVPGQSHVKVNVAVWSERNVQLTELTEGALDEINKEYELRFYKQNPGRFWDYFVMESYLTTDVKARANAETALCEELDKQFETEHQQERKYTPEFGSIMTTLAGASCLLTSGIFSYLISTADAVDPVISNTIKMVALTGGLLTGAGVTAQIYRAELDEEKKQYVRHNLFNPKNQQRISEASTGTEIAKTPRFQFG